MTIKLCENCHVYDGDKYGSCPVCNHLIPDTSENQSSSGIRLEPLSYISDDPRTLSPFSSFSGTDYVTGWLVCIEGPEKGRDYRIHYGFNYVGRSVVSDICVADDKSIAGEKHCSLVYDPKTNSFYVLPGKGTIIFHNDKLLEKKAELNSGDLLSIGESVFEFVPFCKGERKWI